VICAWQYMVDCFYLLRAATLLEANKPKNHGKTRHTTTYYVRLHAADAHVIQLPGSQIWRYSTLFKGSWTILILSYLSCCRNV